MAFNIYQAVTDRIIAQLEAGTIPWRKPWVGQSTLNFITRKPYRGINKLLLPLPGEYMTFKQAKDLGGNVRRGQKGHMIVFYKPIEVTDKEAGEKKSIPFLKYSTVFHLSQIDGIETKIPPTDYNCEAEPLEEAQVIFNSYINKSGVTVHHEEGSDRAYYTPSTDTILLPFLAQFTSPNEYASTAFHEAVHSTGHATRLKRDIGVSAFGTKTYSREELVAEVGSAMLMNECGAELPETFENSAAYINSWLIKLREDNTAILKASSAAQKAVDLILDSGNVTEDEDE